LGIDVLAEAEAREKLYVWFDAPHFIYQRMGFREGKEWEPYWKDQDTKTGSLYWERQYCFCVIFSSDVKS
jgi:methionyl-tRNA synthetase